MAVKSNAGRSTKKHSGASVTAEQYAFPYNAQTIHELEGPLHKSLVCRQHRLRKKGEPPLDGVPGLARVSPAGPDS